MSYSTIKELVTNQFFHKIWNNTTRYCGEITRSQLRQKIESPVPLDYMFLEDVDFLYLCKNFITRLVYRYFEDTDTDHLRNKRFRTCGDYIYLQTRQGIFDFEYSVNKALDAEYIPFDFLLPDHIFPEEANEKELEKKWLEESEVLFEDELEYESTELNDHEFEKMDTNIQTVLENHKENDLIIQPTNNVIYTPNKFNYLNLVANKKDKKLSICFNIIQKSKIILLLEKINLNKELELKNYIYICSLLDYNSVSSEEETNSQSNIELFFTKRFPSFKKILMASWKSFFLSGTLSQFAENLNPLSFITHVRRLTHLGPGGIDKSQASVEIRNLDSSYYGRICPIETPEGFNAGLVHSFSLFTRRELYGELTLPYNLIYKGLTQTKILSPSFFSLEEERVYAIVSGDIRSGKWNNFNSFPLLLRNNFRVEKEKLPLLSFQAFSPYHMISLVTGLIPFLEHNDANRSLMGSNMQRQTVPVIGAEKAYVRTGLDAKLFCDIQSIAQAPTTGFVFNLNERHLSIYNLTHKAKFQYLSFYPIKKTNQNTFILNTSLHKHPRWLEKGDFCMDNSAAKFGKLALGPNLLVAYLPWYGYNYEDAIVLSEKSVLLNTLTSLHETQIACSLELAYREVKKKKEFFYEVPVKSETLLSFFRPAYYQLKETPFTVQNINRRKIKQPSFWKESIPSIGASIKEGDCLISKCRLRLSLTRDLKQQYKDLYILLREVFPLFSDFEEFAYIFGFTSLKSKTLNTKLDQEFLDSTFSYSKLTKESITFKKRRHKAIVNYYHAEDTSIFAKKEQEGFVIAKEIKNIPIVPTSITPFSLDEEYQDIWEYRKFHFSHFFKQTAIIQILKLREIQLGDKCAGRHGNKGIVSRISSAHEMPYLPDGTRIDIVLNPLGIPSRMNVGQLFECLLGLAGFYLKESYTVNLFDEQFGLEASRSFVLSKLYQSSIKTGKSWLFIPNHPGKTRLFDGVTGELFQQPVTVGCSTILKLIHMVDDKMHARSVAGYSPLTQQPTRGKSFLGGQRIGEMELWALQGHGSAWILQELYTLKSDLIELREIFEDYIYESFLPDDLNETNYYSLKDIEYYLATNDSQTYTLEVFLNNLKALCVSVEV